MVWWNRIGQSFRKCWPYIVPVKNFIVQLSSLKWEIQNFKTTDTVPVRDGNCTPKFSTWTTSTSLNRLDYTSDFVKPQGWFCNLLKILIKRVNSMDGPCHYTKVSHLVSKSLDYNDSPCGFQICTPMGENNICIF